MDGQFANTTNIESSKLQPRHKWLVHPLEVHPNTIYVAFNAPQVDEYHRSIFITYPPKRDGTLFHAVYKDNKWAFEQRDVQNLERAQSLVLLHQVGSCAEWLGSSTTDPHCHAIWFNMCMNILKDIDMSAETDRSDDVVKRLGNPVLGGYSCIVWSIDAIAALAEKGFVDLNGMTAEELLLEARLIAGPKDGKSMAGQDHGPVRVVTRNQRQRL